MSDEAAAPPVEVLAGVRRAHARLAGTLTGLDDEVVARPSRLPGWTVGHVLTHIARNADSFRGVAEAAARGEVVQRYPGGPAARDAAIEQGARRPVADLVADVLDSAAALEAVWEGLGSWEGYGLRGELREPVAGQPFRRWREVEVHHHDLGLGFTWADWDAEYVRRELAASTMAWRAARPMGLTSLPPSALALPPAERLAWLTHRLEAPSLGDAPPWP